MVADDKGHGSQLVAALIAAKKEFKAIAKNKTNPHLKNEYADLSAFIAAVDDALAKHGLTLMQPFCFDEKYGHVIRTELLHVSGETKESVYPLPGGVKSQDLGSAITYGRRYSISALLGIAPGDHEDDDGEAAGDAHVPAPARKPAPEPTKTEAPTRAAAQAVTKWSGKLASCESPENGKWKLTAADGTEFATANPEHADIGRSVCSKPVDVTIVYVVQASNGRKRITAIEPNLEGGKK